MVHAILSHPFISKEFRQRFGAKGLAAAGITHVLVFFTALEWMGGDEVSKIFLGLIAAFVIGGLLSDVFCDLGVVGLWILRGNAKFSMSWLGVSLSLLTLAWIGWSIDQGKEIIISVPRDVGLYLVFGGLAGFFIYQKVFALRVEREVRMKEGANKSMDLT